MSTRAVIGRATGDTWEGRYHHSDGYPTGLGARLYEVYGQIGLEQMKTLLIDEHPTGWSTILGCGITQAAGYRDYTIQHPGEPQHPDFMARDYDAQARVYRAWELTQGPQCYCHGDRNDQEEWLIHPDDETWCEWAYILGEREPVMTIFRNRGGTGARQWQPVAVVRLDGTEPLWDGLEAMGDE